MVGLEVLSKFEVVHMDESNDFSQGLSVLHWNLAKLSEVHIYDKGEDLSKSRQVLFIKVRQFLLRKNALQNMENR